MCGWDTELFMAYYKVFINGGGSSPYDAIARERGWKIGVNSGGKNAHRDRVFMVDNNWKQYNHHKHLTAVAYHQPYIATARDIEVKVDQHTLLLQIKELKEYCNKVVIIPKTELIPEMLQIEDVILGLPLGRAENPISWHYALKQDKPVHLLGGSPKRWLKAMDVLGDKIHSFDGNYLSNIARFGKIYTNLISRRPKPWEVENGENFNYRCFAFSLSWVDSFLSLKHPKQLSLF